MGFWTIVMGIYGGGIAPVPVVGGKTKADYYVAGQGAASEYVAGYDKADYYIAGQGPASQYVR